MAERSVSAETAQRLIEWTGERCLPWTPDIQVIYEHYHRYALAAQYVAGKRVLDLASGEGFGASLLAETAAEVLGVDIDADTVEHANRNYADDRVRFHLGSITDEELLSESGTFDVITCFEAIEHVRQQDALMRLVRNRLADGGLFIVSTPDTEVYSHEHGNDNPFHVHELDTGQFERLLQHTFSHVGVLTQNVAVGSVILPRYTESGVVSAQTLKQEADASWSVSRGTPHTYLLAVASDAQLPPMPSAAVLVDADQQLVSGNDGGITQEAVDEIVEQRDIAVADVARLNELYQRGRTEAEDLKVKIEELEQLRADTESELKRSGDEIFHLHTELDRAGTELRRSHREHERDQVRLQWLWESSGALERRAVNAERELAEAQTEIGDLREQNSALVQRAVTKYRRAIERFAPRGTTRRDMYERAMGRPAGVRPRPVTAPSPGPVSVPSSSAPLVSVIIPVHGKWPHTRQCLRSIAEHRVSVPFEVIVVDDDSPDESAARLAECRGVRVVRSERNLGFVGACNLGAENARGAQLLFLNNDTEVRTGWLDELIRTADADERIGLVGAKLVYEDGSLQECGGIVWADGSGWNYGRGAPQHAPEFNVVRDVDYCSGAALMVRTDLFERVGGFDTRYAPAYYEDADLAFAIRATGHRTVVQPKAVVVHHEGVTHGTDTSSGVKRYQELNREEFVRKWESVLRLEHLPEYTPTNLWLGRQRGREGHRGPLVLIADHQVPRPDYDSGSVRMRRIVESFVDMGARVVLFPMNHVSLQPYTEDLQQLGVTVLPTPELQHAFLVEAGPEISLALLSRPQVGWNYLEQLRTCAPGCVVAYDTVDVHFLRLRREAAVLEATDEEAAMALRRKALASRELELALVRSCDITLVVSDVERQLLAELEPAADVRVLSNVHDVEWGQSTPDDRRGVLFVGSFDHPPNVDAARWAASEIMPRVRASYPDAELHIVGSNVVDEVRVLEGDGSNGVVVHGWVADLDAVYAATRVVLAPLRFGAGVKGKVGEGIGLGVPTVGTTIALEGMHLAPGRDVLVADDAEGLAEAVARLLGDDELWRSLSANAKARIAEQFGPDVASRTLAELLDHPVVLHAPDPAGSSSPLDALIPR